MRAADIGEETGEPYDEPAPAEYEVPTEVEVPDRELVPA